MCAGSNPAGGTLYEVPKDPAISALAENGVFAYVQPYATVSGRMTEAAAYLRDGSWSVCRGQSLQMTRPRTSPGAPSVLPLAHSLFFNLGLYRDSDG